MSLVDWEAVVLDLEAHLRSKTSHGQQELLAVIADSRSKHRQVEGLVEKATRLYGPELHQVLTQRPAGEGPDRADPMDQGSPTSPQGGHIGNGNRTTAVA